MLEEVEDGKLVAGHDIRVRGRLDLAPDASQRRLEDLADGWVRGAVGALAGNLERLRDAGVLRGGAGGAIGRRGVDRGGSHGHEVEEGWVLDLVTVMVLLLLLLVVMLLLLLLLLLVVVERG